MSSQPVEQTQSSGDALPRAILRCVLLQQLESQGFASCRRAALETFVDILQACALNRVDLFLLFFQDLNCLFPIQNILDLRAIGSQSAVLSQHAGRCDSSLPDVLAALRKFGAPASSLIAPSSSSMAPLALDLPPLHDILLHAADSHTSSTTNGQSKLAESSLEADQEAPTLPSLDNPTADGNLSILTQGSSHIPRFLPPLPDRHTFISTKDYFNINRDPSWNRVRRIEQNAQVQSALVRLSFPKRPQGSNLSIATAPAAAPSSSTAPHTTIIPPTSTTTTVNPFLDKLLHPVQGAIRSRYAAAPGDSDTRTGADLATAAAAERAKRPHMEGVDIAEGEENPSREADEPSVAPRSAAPLLFGEGDAEGEGDDASPVNDNNLPPQRKRPHLESE